MKRALPIALLVIHCAHAPQPAAAPQQADAPKPAVAAEELEDHWGDSPQTAVTVPADAPDGGADFENDWIFEQYGRFKRNGGGTGTLEGRRYNVVKIELESGEKKTVYFDITDLWARSQ
jgi:hypothetical protein